MPYNSAYTGAQIDSAVSLLTDDANDGEIPIGQTGGVSTNATITGTANQITITNAAGSITISIPNTAAITFSNTGLHILDSNASHDLILKPGSDLSADRTFTITTGDADRTFTINENFTIGDGSAGTLTFSVAGKTLTVEDDSVVNQDLSSDASPTFTTVTIGGAAISATGTEINTVADGSTAKNSHTHGQSSIDSNSIGQSELKTSSSTTGNQTDGNYTMTGGLYCLYPQLKVQSGVGASVDAYLGFGYTGTSYATNIGFDATAGWANAQWYYVSASGEYHWVWLLYKNGNIIAYQEAPDHVCFGNRGAEHPFQNVYDPSRHEIIVVNPDLEDVQRIMARMIPKEGSGYLTRTDHLNGAKEDYFAPERDWFDVFNEMFEVQESKKADWIPEPVSIALPKMLDGIPVDWRFVPQRVWNPETEKFDPVLIEPIKRVIPKPDYITPLQIKRK